MRTTLNIDDELMPDLMTFTHAHTKTEAVRLALQTYVHEMRKQKLLACRGELLIEDNWESLREMETEAMDMPKNET